MFAVNPDIEVNVIYSLDKPIYFKIPTGMKITPNTTYNSNEFEFSIVGKNSHCFGFNEDFIIVNGADHNITEVIDENTISNYSVRTIYFNDNDQRSGRIIGYLV